MSKKNLLLIQPHSDDVLFSASRYLFNAEDYGKITLFTIEGGNEKRTAEDEALCNLFGIDEYITSNVEFEDNSYYTYYKELKFKKFGIAESWECLGHRFGEDFLDTLKADIRKTVKKYKKKNYEVVTCLGIGHPMHFFLRNSIEDLADVFYRDFPHSYKMKAKNSMEEFTSGFKSEPELYFEEESHKMKFEIAYQIYKTQRSLLFFEKGYIDKKIAEEFYRK